MLDGYMRKMGSSVRCRACIGVGFGEKNSRRLGPGDRRIFLFIWNETWCYFMAWWRGDGLVIWGNTCIYTTL